MVIPRTFLLDTLRAAAIGHATDPLNRRVGNPAWHMINDLN